MGALSSVLDGCNHRKSRWTTTVNADPTYEREAPSINGLGRVHMIIFALDYTHTTYAQSSNIMDGKAMGELARSHCGVSSIIEHYERQCTPSTLQHVFSQVSSKMRNDDYLVFFFSGRGAELSADVADEDEQTFREDGEPPLGLTLFNKDGTLVEYSCSRLAELITTSVNPRARVLLMFDCGYSASMIDLVNPMWDDVEAISLNGTVDKEESEDPVHGGLFTASVLYAVQKLQQERDMHYSVGAIFNKMIKEGQRVRGNKENFWLEHGFSATPGSMAWPLLPTTKYDPPVKRRLSRLEARKELKRGLEAEA